MSQKNFVCDRCKSLFCQFQKFLIIKKVFAFYNTILLKAIQIYSPFQKIWFPVKIFHVHSRSLLILNILPTNLKYPVQICSCLWKHYLAYLRNDHLRKRSSPVLLPLNFYCSAVNSFEIMKSGKKHKYTWNYKIICLSWSLCAFTLIL